MLVRWRQVPAHEHEHVHAALDPNTHNPSPTSRYIHQCDHRLPLVLGYQSCYGIRTASNLKAAESNSCSTSQRDEGDDFDLLRLRNFGSPSPVTNHPVNCFLYRVGLGLGDLVQTLAVDADI